MQHPPSERPWVLLKTNGNGDLEYLTYAVNGFRLTPYLNQASRYETAEEANRVSNLAFSHIGLTAYRIEPLAKAE